jgi:hypothetical protein
MNQEMLCVSQETTVCSDWRIVQQPLSVLAPLRVTLIVMKKRPAIVVIYKLRRTTSASVGLPLDESQNSSHNQNLKRSGR